jgi:hypothetical protein
MWIHENCGGEVTWEDFDEESYQVCDCGKTENDEDFYLIYISNEFARQQYIKDLKDRVLTEKIRDWALEGVQDDFTK